MAQKVITQASYGKYNLDLNQPCICYPLANKAEMLLIKSSH